MTMNTGCPDCDRSFAEKQRYCDKHNLEYLKYLAETAQNDYLEELKKQSRKGTNEDSTDS